MVAEGPKERQTGRPPIIICLEVTVCRLIYPWLRIGSPCPMASRTPSVLYTLPSYKVTYATLKHIIFQIDY